MGQEVGGEGFGDEKSDEEGTLAAINAAAATASEAGGEHAREVFIEIPERYAFSFLSSLNCGGA
jgi:hypothetical protein